MYDEKGEKETVMAAEKKIRVVPDPVYRSTDISEIELIRPLWEQLNDHHRQRARAFRNMYDQWTFDDRKKHFIRVAALGPLRIDLAADPLTGRYIGYCIVRSLLKKPARSNRSSLRGITDSGGLAKLSSRGHFPGWIPTALSGTGFRLPMGTKKHRHFIGNSGFIHG